MLTCCCTTCVVGHIAVLTSFTGNFQLQANYEKLTLDTESIIDDFVKEFLLTGKIPCVLPSDSELVKIIKPFLILFFQGWITTGSFDAANDIWLNQFPQHKHLLQGLLLKGKKFLSDLSPKDKPWDKHRNSVDKIAALYNDAGYERYSERLTRCSTFLSFEKVATGQRLKLRNAHFCKHRHCAVCQWRKTLMWTARFLQTMPSIQRDFPKHRYILLTLTIRNCDVTDLRFTLDTMNKAWERLVKRSVFPAVGYIKSVEVTRVFDCYDGSKLVGTHGKTWVEKWEKENKRKLRLVDTMYAHPHFHCLLMVPSGYFGKAGGYLNHAKWAELWQKCLRINYNPVVDVRAVKPDSEGDLVGSLREVLKYSIKEEDLIENKDWLVEITKQLHKTRTISLGGVFKEYISENEPEDYINDGEAENPEETTGVKYYFDWRKDYKRYMSKKDIEL